MGVLIKRVEFRENVRAFFPQGQRKNVCNNEVSVLRGFDCIFKLRGLGNKLKENTYRIRINNMFFCYFLPRQGAKYDFYKRQ